LHQPPTTAAGTSWESNNGALNTLHFAMEAYVVKFGAGMAGGIGWQADGWLGVFAGEAVGGGGVG
jgi:hypothetical protein